MFFSKIHLFAALLIASVSASALPEGCVPNGCVCDDILPGSYCGTCQRESTAFWAVLECGVNPHVDEVADCNSWNFECLPDGGCCSYGVTKQCGDFSSGHVPGSNVGACTSEE